MCPSRGRILLQDSTCIWFASQNYDAAGHHPHLSCWHNLEFVGLGASALRGMVNWLISPQFNEQDPSLPGRLLFNGPSYGMQMLAKRVGGINGTPPQVIVKLELVAEFPSPSNSISLSPFRFRNSEGSGEGLLDILARNEENTVIIGQNNVTLAHRKTAEADRDEGVRVARVKPLGSCGTDSLAENWETDS